MNAMEKRGRRRKGLASERPKPRQRSAELPLDELASELNLPEVKLVEEDE